MFFICWRHVQSICTIFYGIKMLFVAAYKQIYLSCVYASFRTWVSFSDIGTMLKFGTLNCIKLFYNSISGQFNQFLYYVTFSVSRSSFSWLVLFHTSPKILPKESGYVDLKKVVDFVFNFSFSLLRSILIFFQ